MNQSPAYGFAKVPWAYHPKMLKLSQPRMEGFDVERLQETLKKADIVIAVDGEFGPGADTTVKEFHKKKSLATDGIIGRNTRQ